MSQANRDALADFLEGCAYWEAARGASPEDTKKVANRLARLLGIACRMLRGEEPAWHPREPQNPHDDA